MTRAEVARLLGLAAARDRRTVGVADVAAWLVDVGDLDFADAKLALERHFRESTDWLMPAHIRRHVKTIRVERRSAEHHEALALPSRFEADPTRRDRSADVAALIAELRQRLPAVDPAVVRRPEWLRSDRQRQRWPVEPPNPHYDPAALSRLAAMLDEIEGSTE